MAEIRGETRENGWTREHPEPATNQRLDQALIYVSVTERQFTEYKSGRIDARCVEQLGKHLELLDRGLYRAAEWVSVTPLERTPREFQILVQAARDKGLNFKYVTPDREVIKAAIEKGKQQIPGQQLELPGVADKAREAKTQELQKSRDKIADIAKVRDRKERARERLANIRQIVRTREEADRARAATEAAARRVALEFPTPDQLKRIEAPAANRAEARGSPEAAKAALVEKVERDAARLAAREFPFPVPDKPREQQGAEIGERTTPEPADAARGERATAEREAADKARETAAQQREAEAREAARTKAELDQARDAAYREMLNQAQVPEHVRLGLSHAQAPEAAVQTPPGQAPSVERGGTGQGRDPRAPEIGPRTQ
ncbi:hypothetical protein [Nocardia sp. XZ_19_369]|uniref:hypothetical protein n=1 Tax=Nocardia sp. XZ_19_369 TaxID=2769487 RepID=UPI00188F8AFC|nr:hypothetical protein [Nocardia sp. XZ_19_369]